jgi:hypothetical protein
MAGLPRGPETCADGHDNQQQGDERQRVRADSKTYIIDSSRRVPPYAAPTGLRLLLPKSVRHTRPSSTSGGVEATGAVLIRASCTFAVQMFLRNRCSFPKERQRIA